MKSYEKKDWKLNLDWENHNSFEEKVTTLQDFDWDVSYRTSSLTEDGRVVDILHDFYIPALRCSIQYDRVAGYFTSSSLAAASQGFSSFVGKQGKMRLIVGSDLAPQDVEAILRGNDQSFVKRLKKELKNREDWPEGVQNGVELLAWMVAQQYLEVKVAFRINEETREPIPYKSIADGYVHEKWAIFKDGEDNKLLATGSLNESKQALTRNAENLDVHCDWWGEREIERIERAETDFQALWEDNHPHFRVLTLPDAVKNELVRIGENVDFPQEIDGTSEVEKEIEPPSVLERLRFALLRDGPRLPGGRFVGMETAPVEPWPHQSIVARRLINTWPYSYMLCDEVGLGKTIEAGLAIRSLYLNGLIERVLIAPPASLKKQWQREMASKFLLPFSRTQTSPQLKHHYIFPREDQLTSNSPFYPKLNIVSAAILSRRERQSDIKGADPFDLVVVDEAHACRRRNPTDGIQANPDYGYLYQTVSGKIRKKAQSLWLATATPMQLDAIEAWDLFRLTHRTGVFQDDPSLTMAYYNYLNQLLVQGELSEDEWDFIRAVVNSTKQMDPLLWEYLRKAVINSRLRRPTQKWLENGIQPRGQDRKRIRRLIFSAAPLSRVMMRHSRSLLEIYKERGQLTKQLAQREILPLPKIEFPQLERVAYDQLEEYCDELVNQINQYNDQQMRYSIGFYKSFLRLRFASSFYAITQTLKRRKTRVIETLEFVENGKDNDERFSTNFLETLVMDPEEEDAQEAEEAVLKNRSPGDLRWEAEKLDTLLSAFEQLTGPSSKLLELLNYLDKRRDEKTGRIRQTVIFTRFYDTLTHVVRQLRRRAPEMLIGTYSGQGGKFYDPTSGSMRSVDRDRVKHLFLRGKIDVLVCTDAAAEGLNLQTANLIINYDLPWNPMKVEQRIGRLDRIGQKHDHVFVINLCYLGTTEEKVYGRLLDRLRQAGLIVGTQQISMLPVKEDEFGKLADGELSEDELAEIAQERIIEQQKRTRSMEIPPEDLYQIYMRFEKEQGSIPSPIDLDDIWQTISESQYLQNLGCQVNSENGSKYLVIRGIDGVPDESILTTSRELYEEGLPGNSKAVHFASYGDPYFDALLDHFEQYKLPDNIRRIDLQLDEVSSEIVAYAFPVSNKDGEKEIEFITTYEGIDNIKILGDVEFSQTKLDRYRDKLEEIAREELAVIKAAQRIEKENLRAGKAQNVFTTIFATGLLNQAIGIGEKSENFWRVAEGLERKIDEEGETSIKNLPANKLRELQDYILFDIHVPSIGEKATILASSIILHSALDKIVREADAMKVKRSELESGAVLTRLRRLEEEAFEEFQSI